MVALNKAPPLMLHHPCGPLLWLEVQEDTYFDVHVKLLPTGAIKVMRCFEAFAETHGVTQQAIRAAYKAAAAGAAAQRRQGLGSLGQKQFLVSSADASGPDFSAGGLRVQTQPLGHRRDITTEKMRAV